MNTEPIMRAAVINAPGDVQILRVPVPVPQPNEVRVHLEGCGVCASNLPPWEGKPWFTYPLEPGRLGHEGWGHIDAVGANVTGWQIGERVSILSNHAYAEYDVAPQNAVVRVPDALRGKPFPGEPLGCALNIFRRSEIKRGQMVAVIGIGFLGALLTRMAADMDTCVIAITRREYALDVARNMGASDTLIMDDHGRVIEAVKNLTDGRFCDVVIEAVGKQEPLDLAGELCRERGRLIVAGYHQDGLRTVNMQLWNWRGLDVINAHERELRVYVEGVQDVAQLVANGILNPFPLYTHTYPLERLADALNATRDRPAGFMKALVMM